MFNNQYVVYGLLLLFIIHNQVSYCYHCKNEQNQPVDWYVLYKIPRLTKSSEKLLTYGVAYMYITSETVNKGWTLSPIGIDDEQSMPSLTLQPLYQDTGCSFMVYNDQPPDKSESDRGHTKGVVLANATHGLWLIHSVPHFPKYSQKGDRYKFPPSGQINGQSFLCISMDIANINLVGKQLYYNEPHIYLKLIGQPVQHAAPDFAAIDNINTVNQAPWHHIQNITSLKKQTFLSFAKSKNFNKELYTDLVAPYLITDLYVESWQNGDGKLLSNCTSAFEIDNVKSIDMNVNDILFPSTIDHSKWAITYKQHLEEKLWVCIGDINRAAHQLVRGGGTVCINNDNLWQQYLNIISKVETCKRKKFKTKKHHFPRLG